MLKTKFLELGISELSLKRKLAENGLSLEDLDNVTSVNEHIIYQLFDYFLDISNVVGEGKELEREKLADLVGYANLQSDIINTYEIILIDTCCITESKSHIFFQALENILSKTAKKPTIYIIEDVKRELLNLKERFLTAQNIAGREQIKENLDILLRLKDRGYVKEVPRLYQEDGQRVFLADLELFQIYDREINRRDAKPILILTNDNALQFDFYQRFTRLSVAPLYMDKNTKQDKVRRLKSKLAKIRHGKYIPICESDNYQLTVTDIDFKRYLVKSIYFKQAEFKFLNDLINKDFFNENKFGEHRNKKHSLTLRDKTTGSHKVTQKK